MRSATMLAGWLATLVLVARVNAVVIHVDAEAPPGGNGTTWPTAFQHPADALDVAQAGDEVWVAAGTYHPLVDDTCLAREATIRLVSAVAVYGGFAGGETKLGQRDPEANPTVLSGVLDAGSADPCCGCVCETCRDLVCELAPFCCEIGWDSLCAGAAASRCDTLACYDERALHIVTADGTTPGTRLDGFIITDGFTARENEGGAGLRVSSGELDVAHCFFTSHEAREGGAATLLDSAVRFTSCSFTECTAFGGQGGAVRAEASDVLMERCTFESNSAENGGALYTADGTLMLLECRFSDNGVGLGRGGALWCDGGVCDMRGCVFEATLPPGLFGTARRGGAVFIANGSVTALDCVFLDLTVSASGGAIAFADQGADGATLCLEDSIFRGNIAWGNLAGHAGGALYGGVGAIIARRCVFVDNHADDPATENDQLGGGAIQSYRTTTLTECTFEDNTATGWAGAVSVLGSDDVAIDRCTFTGNHATRQGGGALYFGEIEGEPLVTRCTFRHNEARWGGAVADVNCSSRYDSCVLRSNRARDGSAIVAWTYLPYLKPAAPTFVNCLIAGNTGDDTGGAAACWADSAPTFVNCTLVNNTTAGNGPAIVVGSSAGGAALAITNSVLWGNTGDLNDQQITYGHPDSTATVEYSNVEGGFPGPGNIDADPLFVAAPHGDYRLAAGSPCIDAGDNGAMTATTDLAGLPRRVDDPSTPDTGLGEPPVVDMGAYEFQADGCPADCEPPGGNGVVDAEDLLAVLAAWGEAGACDVNGDGAIDAADVDAVLAVWGACP